MNIDWDNILVDENSNKLFDIFLDKFNLAKQKSIPKINSKKVIEFFFTSLGVSLSIDILTFLTEFLTWFLNLAYTWYFFPSLVSNVALPCSVGFFLIFFTVFSSKGR
jgi:hypothetical protein